jgi:magnesium-transporting ATPase (P-type)
VIVLNVAIGLIQEGKAEAAAEALSTMLSAKAMVLRNDKQTSIESSEVVIGDVLYLQAGDNIGADVRFFSLSQLKVRESALTGESEDVEKTLALCAEDAPLGDRKNCGFAGTACSSGQGAGVVIAIGSTAQLGSIKTLIDEADTTQTPLQQQLEVFGRVLSIITILVAIGAFLIAWLARNEPLAESFSIGVGIAVAIIPEGLPSVVTITLAIGVRRMAAHNAIIRQLPAVETLGSVSVVCSDKTGTLTVNQMMVTKMRTRQQQYGVEGQGYDPYSGDVQGSQGSVRKAEPDRLVSLYWLALPGVIANDGGLAAPNLMAAMWPSRRQMTDKVAEADAAAKWEIAGDPTDVAVLVLGHKLGIEGNVNSFKAQFAQLAKIPFDSDYKFVATLQDVDTDAGRKRMVYIKGAWDEVIRRCSTQAANENAFAAEPCDQSFWSTEASSYASNGMRVLAIAQWEVPTDKTTLTVEEIRDAALASPCLQVSIVDAARS